MKVNNPIRTSQHTRPPWAKASRALDATVEKSNAARAEVTLYAIDGLVLVDVRGVPLARAAAALGAVKKALA